MAATAPPRADLPRWAETLRQKYLAGEASTFVLYRNVFDNFLVSGKLHGLQSFLVEELFKDTKKRVVEVSLERGIRHLSGKPNVALAALSQDSGLEPSLLQSLHVLEAQMRSEQSTAVIVPYACLLYTSPSPRD